MGSNNFLDLENQYSDYSKSKYFVLPIPFDRTSTWKKGADKGPKAIIDASAYVELYDIENDSEPYKAGISTGKNIRKYKNPEQMIYCSKKKASEVFEDCKIPVFIGGEHSITIGPAFAAKEKFENITFIQFDAHADLRDEYEGSKYNHACVMARIQEHSPIIQIGLRSMDVSEKNSMNMDRVFFADEITGNSYWIDRLIPLLKGKVYITIDLDVFDPSVMPSTGTPEPGGLGWYTVLSVLKLISEKCEIVAFDVVELCPQKSMHHSDFLAAKLIYKMISYIEGNK